MHPSQLVAISSPNELPSCSGSHARICRLASHAYTHSHPSSQASFLVSPDWNPPLQSRRKARMSRCSAERKTQRDSDRQLIPPPPPPPFPQRLMQPLPPPPPPPPPPESRDGVLGPFGRRGSLLAIMFGGAALLSLSIRARDPPPQFYQYNDSDAFFTRTAGGAELAVFSDELGNFYWVDAHFNFWYDTGDPRLGVYVVDPNGVTLNIYIDGDGEPQYIPIGNLDDIRQVEVNEIGGVPIEAMQKAAAKTQRLYVFPGKDGVSLPDSAPAEIGPDGTIRPPRMLEEGGIMTEERPKSLWPFGDRVPDDDPFQRK